MLSGGAGGWVAAGAATGEAGHNRHAPSPTQAPKMAARLCSISPSSNQASAFAGLVETLLRSAATRASSCRTPIDDEQQHQ